MHIIGLTGSIGMGKSTVAAMLRHQGVAVHCADAAVHRLLAAGGGAVAAVAACYPPARTEDGAGRPYINRVILSAAALQQPSLLARLEKILHPLVHQAEATFLKRARQQRRRMVVLDIPLLFETGGEKRVDAVWVVSAPGFLQRQRVLARRHMTPQKFAAMLAKQLPDAQKRRRAAAIIPTGLGRGHSWRVVKRLLRGYSNTKGLKE